MVFINIWGSHSAFDRIISHLTALFRISLRVMPQCTIVQLKAPTHEGRMCQIGLRQQSWLRYLTNFIRAKRSTNLLSESCLRLPPRRLVMSNSQKRQRGKALRVWVKPKEKVDIEGAANDCSLSVSTYLRSLGLGYVPPSKIDKTHILALAKVNGDQGRLGGLLKMWLTNEERQEEALSAQVRTVLEQIDEVQRLLMERVSELDKHQ